MAAPRADTPKPMTMRDFHFAIIPSIKRLRPSRPSDDEVVECWKVIVTRLRDGFSRSALTTRDYWPQTSKLARKLARELGMDPHA